MHNRRFRAPSPAFVISLIALFVALGGTTYAATTSLPYNSVGSQQLKAGAVTPPKVAQATLALFKGKIVTYDATASAASPPIKTLGTFLGDTFGASCSMPAPGVAQLFVYLKTSNGAWKADVTDIFAADGGTATSQVYRANWPPGTFSTSQLFGLSSAAAGGHKRDTETDFVQLAPSPGSFTLHLATSTPNATHATGTCHFMVQVVPATLTPLTD